MDRTTCVKNVFFCFRGCGEKRLDRTCGNKVFQIVFSGLRRQASGLSVCNNHVFMTLTHCEEIHLDRTCPKTMSLFTLLGVGSRLCLLTAHPTFCGGPLPAQSDAAGAPAPVFSPLSSLFPSLFSLISSSLPSPLVLPPPSRRPAVRSKPGNRISLEYV